MYTVRAKTGMGTLIVDTSWYGYDAALRQALKCKGATPEWTWYITQGDRLVEVVT